MQTCITHTCGHHTYVEGRPSAEVARMLCLRPCPDCAGGLRHPVAEEATAKLRAAAVLFCGALALFCATVLMLFFHG